MRFHPLALLFSAALCAAVIGCNGDVADDREGGDSAAVADSTPREVRIVKGEHGPPYPDAKLAVLSPAPEAVVTGDSVMVKVELTGVDLAAPTPGEQGKGIAYSKEGQHIHVIVDDKPYMAMYQTDSFSVGKLADGIHTIRAFPSRSWHESIKVPTAFVQHSFYVKKKTGDPVVKPGEPLLTYSRPKGDYKGDDAKRILLDFFVANAELGPDKYRVVASIDGQVKDTLTEWIPYYIEGLSDGSHTIGLQLIGPDGAPVPGPFNTVERTINVNPPAASTSAAAPAGDSSMGHGGMGGHGDTTRK